MVSAILFLIWYYKVLFRKNGRRLTRIQKLPPFTWHPICLNLSGHCLYTLAISATILQRICFFYQVKSVYPNGYNFFPMIKKLLPTLQVKISSQRKPRARGIIDRLIWNCVAHRFHHKRSLSSENAARHAWRIQLGFFATLYLYGHVLEDFVHILFSEGPPRAGGTG